MASSGNGPQQSQHVQGAAEGLFARVKQVASGILAEVSQAGTVIRWKQAADAQFRSCWLPQQRGG